MYGNGYIFLIRQLVWLALGLGGMFALMNMDYRKLRQPRVIFTGLSVATVMLVGVFFLDKSHATHRWIRVGPAQPAAFRTRQARRDSVSRVVSRNSLRARAAGIDDWRRTLLPALGPCCCSSDWWSLEPDLGTACMIFLIAVVMLFVAGLSYRYIFGAALAVLPAIYLLIVRVSYRMRGSWHFFRPNADPQGHGFQLLQSLIAVGSGGFTGVGLMESKQKLFYLPEAHTDFIFAVICEELGFIGAMVVLALFAIYGWRGLRAAIAAPDDFGRFLALGITVMVVGQALINLGVVLGMMPTKGIPLPFISYGGSSLLVMLLATGVLLNISQQAEET